jgi:hypothetical protein
MIAVVALFAELPVLQRVLGEFRKYPEFFSLIPQSMRHLSLAPAGITKLLLCADRGGFLHIFVTRESEPETVPI